MFTGLVADLGTVVGRRGDAATACASAWRRALAGELGEGDSVAVNGVCLTATRDRRRRASPPT